ncbi:hypothetical protein F5Y11DRAFT_350223 [Daldinia sp. FL1419]|nr:hypothetical protein F5Y11DRAFT_350223 [Daldinia sp. FL1419]
MDDLSRLESQSGIHNSDPNQATSLANGITPMILGMIYHKMTRAFGILFNASLGNSQSDIPPYIHESIVRYSRGYPRLAALVASDQDNLIIRQFGYLHARVLLDLQDKLQGYEEDLERCDRESRKEGPPAGNAHSLESIQKMDLLMKIEDTLKRYRAMMDYPHFQHKPPEIDIRSLINLCKRHAPSTNDKKKYYLRKDDLIMLGSPEDKARIDKQLAKFLFHKPSKLAVLGDAEGTRRQRGFIILSKDKISAAMEVILISTLIVVLIFPIYPFANAFGSNLERTYHHMPGISHTRNVSSPVPNGSILDVS